MKKRSVGMVMCLFMLLSEMYAQSIGTKANSTIEPLRLAISTNKTTNLVFPYSITSVDRGNKDVLVQKAKGVENILQVKAANDSLVETNLTTVLADGSLYSFLISYALEPSVLNLQIGLRNNQDQPAGILPFGNDNEAKVKQVAQIVFEKKPTMRRPKDKRYDIAFKLTGLYVNEDNFLFQFALGNNTNIRYDIDQLRFFIRDKKIAKRTAAQELELTPIYVIGNQKSIEVQSQQYLVLVVPKFTIPEQKYLSIALIEKSGGRNLSLRVKNKKLVAASMVY
ncbi:MAG: conjugative transposon protein TraN [Sphingobacteriales bacterium]|nr:conjugative transposon protein TraN [Sphingobacteriales bacterium]OJV98830.1 MAG: conjugative transposon protein TraN [Sphingobacteriales bacterium 44-61]